MLRDRFLELCAKTCNVPARAQHFWEELRTAYEGRERQYHNLLHLEQLFTALDQCPAVVLSEALTFAVFYHDIVYDITRGDNEAQSAMLAADRLQQLGVQKDTVMQCSRLILATKAHTQTGDSETDHFTDADLSILGSVPERYHAYCRQIRQEYALYPDDMYRPGRAKVLRHFLDMPSIYKTPYFQERYEDQARQNLRAELEELQGRV